MNCLVASFGYNREKNRSLLLPELVMAEYDTVSDVVESKVHQCQQNSDA